MTSPIAVSIVGLVTISKVLGSGEGGRLNCIESWPPDLTPVGWNQCLLLATALQIGTG